MSPPFRALPGSFRGGPSAGAAALLAFLSGCGGAPPDDLGPVEAGGLRPCEEVPNCVHTGQGHPEEYPPFVLTDPWREADPDDVWRELVSAVEALPRTRVVTHQGAYLHAESRTRILRFVDDLELYWEPGDAEVVVRSESRVGRNDFGVNLRRVETLRGILEEREVLE